MSDVQCSTCGTILPENHDKRPRKPCPTCGGKRRSISPTVSFNSVAHASAELSTANSFAQDWLADALQEAKIEEGFNARRREIVFAASLAECYIFEWTRGLIDVAETELYFGRQNSRGLPDKWGKIPNMLFEAKKIDIRPDLNLKDLKELVKYRNGLIHSKASRYSSSSSSPDLQPFPTKEDLNNLKPGWAISTVVDVIKELHRQTGTSMPHPVREILEGLGKE